MSAFVTIVGAGTYRVSGHTQEHNSQTFEGRLANEVSIEAKAKAVDSGNPIRTINLSIRNDDNFIDTVTQNLWGFVVSVEVDGVSDVFTGVIRSFNTDENGLLSIGVTEDTLSWFKPEIPDEIVRVSSYSNASRDAVNTPIPTPFGGTASDPLTVRGVLVDRVNFRWIFCSGEIRQIVGVKKNRSVVTEGFTAFTGSSSQSIYPGFAYIQFDSDPRVDGIWPEILVDIVGLKLGSLTEAECRNPATILYYLLTTTDEGPCGWGLNVPVEKIGDSFTTAISDCASNGFVIDGSINAVKPASYWINQICLACRGRVIFTGGKIEFYVDKNTSSVKTYNSENMALKNIGRWESSARKNRHILNYRYDVADGIFLSSAIRDDSTSQSVLKATNQEMQDALLIRDYVSANKIIDYLSKTETYGEDKIRFETMDYSGVSEYSVITINRPDKNLYNALYRVISLVMDGFIGVVEARSYNTNVFANDAASGTSDPPLDPRSLSPVSPPVAVSGVSLSAGVRQQPDGTIIAFIDGIFTEGERTVYTKIEFGEGSSPTTWKNLGDFTGGSFHFEPCKIDTLYTFKFTAMNTGGSSSAVTASITSGKDATAPGTPVAPVASVLFKSIRVKCAQNETKAPDLAGFKLFRNTSDNSGTASEIDFVPCGGNETNVTYLDEGTGYGITYFYWTKAVDTSGNASGFSSTSNSATTLQVVAGDIGAEAVTAVKLANQAVTAAKTQIAAIDPNSGNLTANSVAAVNIVAGTITGDKIYGGTITGDKIYGGTITGDKIASNTIVAGNIQAGAIQTGHLAAAGISADCIKAGTMSAAYISGGTLSASVSLSATSGTIGGWTINNESIYKTYYSSDVISIHAQCKSIFHYKDASGNYGEWMGQINNNSTWTGRYGFAITRGVGNYVFRADTDADGCSPVTQIAGWDFDTTTISNGYVRLTSSSSGSGRGLYAYAPTYAHATVGNVFEPSTGWTDRHGLHVMEGDGSSWTNTLFEVSANCSGTKVMKIAGFNFSATGFSQAYDDSTYHSYFNITARPPTSTAVPNIFIRQNYGIGVWAITASQAITGEATGGNFGVVGSASGSYGVRGTAGSQYGVYGEASVDAVYGYASNTQGGRFNSANWPALLVEKGLYVTGGDVYVFGCVCAIGYCTLSSREYKRDITPVENILSGIRSLNMVAFRYNDDESDGWHFGAIAEDFKQIFPWLSDGRSIPMLDTLAIQGIQELDKMVSSQQETIQNLESRVKALECKLAA